MKRIIAFLLLLTALFSVDSLFIPTASAETTVYSVTYAQVDESKIDLRNKVWKVNEGETLQVEIVVKSGYKVLSVLYDGERMPYNAQTGKYEIVPDRSGEVVVSVIPVSSNIKPNYKEIPKENNEWILPVAIGGGVLLTAGAALVIILIVKARHNP